MAIFRVLERGDTTPQPGPQLGPALKQSRDSGASITCSCIFCHDHRPTASAGSVSHDFSTELVGRRIKVNRAMLQIERSMHVCNEAFRVKVTVVWRA